LGTIGPSFRTTILEQEDSQNRPGRKVRERRFQPPGCARYADVEMTMQWADENKYRTWEKWLG
jgi:hypothetical protein